ncbi:MAG: malate dehydrogenase [Sedimentisphaerales bacterium]|jgi:malate dehydrogenase|nr:malate dehydrogenase [Sedimentisphaerales bacterium]
MSTRKVGIVGAGQIGGQLAMLIAERGLADVVLMEVPDREGLAAGKALDIMHATAVLGIDADVRGTSRSEDLAGSDAIVITAGQPRRPGQSRDDLLRINLGIIQQVAVQIKAVCPKAFCVVVTNPLDAMVYAFQKVSGMPTHMVVGMAGVLDSGRFRGLVAWRLGLSVQDVSAMVLGGHGPTMVPLTDTCMVGGAPVRHLLPPDQIEDIVQQTRTAGDQIVSLLGNGSAFFSPAASVLLMLEAYLCDRRRVLPAAAYLDGQYGCHGIYMGVPVVIGKGGVERIVEIQLDTNQQAAFDRSVQAVRQTITQVEAFLSR